MTPRRPAVLPLALVLLAAAGLSGCTPAPGPGSPAPTGVPAPSTPPATSTPAAAPFTPDGDGSPGVGARGSATGDTADVVVTGDVLLHPPLWQQARTDGTATEPDFRPLLSGLAPYLADADLAICSLETPVGTTKGPYRGYPSFVVPPQILPALKSTGYDACTTATNHAVDGGTTGVERTLDALDDAGLAHTGTYRSAAAAATPLILDAGGARVGIVAATYGLNGQSADAPWRVDLIDAGAMIAKARAARRAGADVVLAGFHAGQEYSNAPTAAQRTLAHRLADSGEFDFIYSHHTHSVLPMERYRGVWIAYGLGNSVSAHATDLAVNREGASIRMRFTRRGGGWTAGAPRWAAHIMATDPVRWCALPAREPCTTPAGDRASLKRTRATLERLGAADAGARMWAPASR